MSQHWAFGWHEFAAFANAGAVVIAALVGVWGVRRWRTERIETRQAELAEEALALMYQAPEVFDHIRSPMSFSGEGATRQRGEGETAEEARARDSDFVPLERINYHREYFERVIKIRPSIKAIFGKDKASPLDKILEIRSRIILAVRMLYNLQKRTHFRTEQQRDEHHNRVEQYDSIKWKTSDESDEIDIELHTAIAETEALTEPILRSRLRTSAS